MRDSTPLPPQERDPDVPAWVYELVAVADHARTVLVSARLLLAVSAAGALTLGWLGPRALGPTGLLAAATGLMAASSAATLVQAWATTPAQELPRGWRTGVQLVLVDIVLTFLGVLLLGGLTLAGSPEALQTAALAALGAGAVSIGLLLVSLPRRGVGAAVAAALAVAYLLALVLLGPGSWWAALVVALAVDAASVLAWRLGR